jgi:hypothetical protein
MTKSTAAKNTKNVSYGSLSAIQAASSTSQLIDILLTNAFPTHVTVFSSAALPTPIFPPPSLAADAVSEVVRKIKPRYHFVAGGGSQTPPQFWEREPFMWEGEDGRVTRFLSLGAFGGQPPAGKKPRVSSFDLESPSFLSACVLVVLRLLNISSKCYHWTFASPSQCY